jgi:hypothetical protein
MPYFTNQTVLHTKIRLILALKSLLEYIERQSDKGHRYDKEKNQSYHYYCICIVKIQCSHILHFISYILIIFFFQLKDKRPKSVFHTKGHILQSLYPSCFVQFYTDFRKRCVTPKQKPQKSSRPKVISNCSKGRFAKLLPKGHLFAILEILIKKSCDAKLYKVHREMSEALFA